jgi:hypothetical protein
VLFLLASRAGACVAEMDFDSSYMFLKVGQFVLNQTFDMACERFTTFGAVICIDFDMHSGSFLKLPREWQGFLSC